MGYMATYRDAAEAEDALGLWAFRRRESEKTRDEVVRAAVAAGVSKHRVHILTGIARTTVDRIISGEET